MPQPATDDDQVECPSWVKSCPDGPEVRLQLCPRKRTQIGHRAMSEKCQKPTYARQQTAALLDHLVGVAEQCGRYCEAERLGGLEIHGQLDSRNLLHREVSSFFALEDATRVKSDLSVIFYQARPVTDEPAAANSEWVESLRSA